MGDAPYLAVIVPAYNEEARLLPALNGLHDYYSRQPYSYSVTVVCDGCTDSTVQIVDDFSSQHPAFCSLSYSPNRGKGFAVRYAILRAKGEYILFCDADLATPPEETAKLLAAIQNGADVAIGSRPLQTSKLEIRQPFYREMLGRTFNRAVQLLAIKGIQDTQCGFKLFKAAAAREVFARCQLNGFSFDIEALLVARDLGYTITEIPIRWRHQDGSKVSLVRDGLKMLRDLVLLRLKGKRSRTSIREEISL